MVQRYMFRKTYFSGKDIIVLPVTFYRLCKYFYNHWWYCVVHNLLMFVCFYLCHLKSLCNLLLRAAAEIDFLTLVVIFSCSLLKGGLRIQFLWCICCFLLMEWIESHFGTSLKICSSVLQTRFMEMLTAGKQS